MNENLIPPNPPKAYKNLDFLNSHDARSIRVLCELIEPQQRFSTQNIENTIVFFGSARSIDSERAHRKAESLAAEAAKESDISARQRLEESAAYVLKLAKYYDDAMALAAKITRWSTDIEKEENRFYICSGGGPGMMEAANRGAHSVDGKSIGFGISLPFEQHINPYCTEELSFEFHYFFTRKYWFLYLAKALVAFPGGFGTMDELFEMLTLLQTRKLEKKVPILLFGTEFWNDILNFDAFRKWGVISESDLALFRITDDVDEAYAYLVNELTNNHLS